MQTPRKAEVLKTPNTKITMSATAGCIRFGISTIEGNVQAKHGFDAQGLDTPLAKRGRPAHTQRKPKEYSREFVKS